MSEATFEGATVEAALEAAAAEIGAAVSDLDYEVIEEKTDFWGTGDSTFVIKARTREQAAEPAEEAEEEASAKPAEEAGEETSAKPTEDVRAFSSQDEERADEPDGVADAVPGEAVASSEAVGGGEDRSVTESAAAEDKAAPPTTEASGEVMAVESVPKPDETGDAEREGVEPAAISGILEQIFHDMEFECTVTVEAEEDGFLATVDGADKEALLEGNGRCLSALELLINNAFRHKLPRGHKVRVDAGDFRNRRDEELSDLALQVAHSAKDSGRTQETQPLNPYERRLVHLALAEDPAVTTRSRGSGFLKNVQVIPRGGGGGRSRGRRD